MFSNNLDLEMANSAFGRASNTAKKYPLRFPQKISPLYPEIWKLIFSFLELRDIDSIVLVSTSFNKWMTDYLREFLINECSPSDEVIAALRSGQLKNVVRINYKLTFLLTLLDRVPAQIKPIKKLLDEAYPGELLFWYCLDDNLELFNKNLDPQTLQQYLLLALACGSEKITSHLLKGHLQRQTLHHPHMLKSFVQMACLSGKKKLISELHNLVRISNAITDDAVLCSVLSGNVELATGMYQNLKTRIANFTFMHMLRLAPEVSNLRRQDLLYCAVLSNNLRMLDTMVTSFRLGIGINDLINSQYVSKKMTIRLLHLYLERITDNPDEIKKLKNIMPSLDDHLKSIVCKFLEKNECHKPMKFA